jgi:hypothetical protein
MLICKYRCNCCDPAPEVGLKQVLCRLKVLCSCRYCALDGTVQPTVLCSQRYCAFDGTVQLTVLCSGRYCAADGTVQSTVLCSRRYCAVDGTVQQTVLSIGMQFLDGSRLYDGASGQYFTAIDVELQYGNV